MAINNPFAAYQENSVNSASGGQLTLMLFGGAQKFVNLAVLHINSGNPAEAHNAITRVQDIIGELQSTLNMEYQIAQQLAPLYQFMQERLLAANVKKDKEILAEVLDLVSDLKGAWVGALRKL